MMHKSDSEFISNVPQNSKKIGGIDHFYNT